MVLTNAHKKLVPVLVITASQQSTHSLLIIEYTNSKNVTIFTWCFLHLDVEIIGNGWVRK